MQKRMLFIILVVATLLGWAVVRWANSRVGPQQQATLKSIIGSMPRSCLVSSDNHYLHAQFRSRLFGFVDDVEFLIDEGVGVIHFRAAARVGHSDLGVNRSRMEQILKQYAAHWSNSSSR
jgi:uncharacterized protein (DUF1499 family)